MRMYIEAVENGIYRFVTSKAGACNWYTLLEAQSKAAIMEDGGVTADLNDQRRGDCFDFRVEERSKGEFVISCGCHREYRPIHAHTSM